MTQQKPLKLAKGPSTLAGDGPIWATAPAKVNLSLKITGRRPNGYHDLDTVMARLELADRLWFEFLTDQASDHLQLWAPGQFDEAFPGAKSPAPLAQGGAQLSPLNQAFTHNNLILKALAAYRLHTGWPKVKVGVYLEKNIPIGAGLGGGSSDGAAVLRFLNNHAPKPLSEGELLKLGLSLGADVPFFLQPKPLARATGVGEIFSDPPESWSSWAGKPLILVNPGLELSTPEVFKNWDLTNQSVNHNIALMIPAKPGDNDLLSSARQLVPAVEAIVAALEELGLAFWGLSGSGPTFWLDPDLPTRKGQPGSLDLKSPQSLSPSGADEERPKVFDLGRFQADHPGWLIWKTKISGP